MVKKLRIKLLAITMGTLFAVLACIIGITALLSYEHIVVNADDVLVILGENKGIFPSHDSDVTSKDPYQGKEIPYESRYFYAYFKNDLITELNTEHVNRIPRYQAQEMGEAIYESKRYQGFLDDYRYLRVDEGEGVRIIFLDCTRQLNNFNMFTMQISIVSLVGYIIVFIIAYFVSFNTIKPFLLNEEKQKRFISDAGHELKTPITIVNADLEILKMTMENNEWINDIALQNKRISSLTNDLITLSKSEEYEAKENFIEFSLSDLVEDNLKSFESLISLNKKNLIKEIEPLITLKSDEKRVLSIFNILIDNAIKYSDDNGTIKVRLQKVKKKAILTVFNTCEYISKDSIDRLFDRFYRNDDSRNNNINGFGLGLSIAQANANVIKAKISASTYNEKSLKIIVTFNL